MGDTRFGADAFRLQLVAKRMNGAQSEIAGVDMPDGLSFLSVDGKAPRCAVGGWVIAERYNASHPHPLGFGRRDLVADPLAGHFAFKLGEGQQHV